MNLHKKSIQLIPCKSRPNCFRIAFDIDAHRPCTVTLFCAVEEVLGAHNDTLRYVVDGVDAASLPHRPIGKQVQGVLGQQHRTSCLPARRRIGTEVSTVRIGWHRLDVVFSFGAASCTTFSQVSPRYPPRKRCSMSYCLCLPFSAQWSMAAGPINSLNDDVKFQHVQSQTTYADLVAEVGWAHCLRDGT